jgi:hypothetical protein
MQYAPDSRNRIIGIPLGIKDVGGENGFDFAHRIAPSNGILMGIKDLA